MKLVDDKQRLKGKALKKRTSQHDRCHSLQDRGKRNLVTSEGNKWKLSRGRNCSIKGMRGIKDIEIKEANLYIQEAKKPNSETDSENEK